MKKMTFKITGIAIITVIYFAYSGWIKSLDQDKIIFQLFDPFKLLLVASLFAIIASAIKQLLFGKMKQIKTYKSAKRQNLLFNFDKTIDYTEKLLHSIREEDVEAAKNLIDGYQGKLKYLPIYLEELILDLSDKLIIGSSIKEYEKAAQGVLESLYHVYKREKEEISNKKTPIMFDVKRTGEYYNANSSYLIQYYTNLGDEKLSKKQKSWKISSLQILNFFNSLFLSLVMTSIIFVIIGALVKNSSGETYLFKTPLFYSGWIFAIVMVAIVLFSVGLMIRTKKISGVKVYWINLLVFFLLAIIATLNVAASITMIDDFNNLPEISDKNDVAWYNTKLIMILMLFLNIFLSTNLVIYIAGAIIDTFKKSTFELKKFLVDTIIPSVIFIATIAFLWGSKISNADAVNEGNASSIVKNVLINNGALVVFWGGSAIYNSIVSETIR